MAGEVGSVFVRVGANTGDFDRGMGRVHSTLGRFGGLARAAGMAAVAGGAAIATGFAFAIKAAATFEQQLNTFQAVSGATGKEMVKVSKLAKKMGADLTLPGTSAKDAAEALTELAKGGLTVNKAMKALKATLQLSAAAQITNARAAVIVSDALNSFGLKAKDATRVVDLLANAANATSGDIEDFADAMQMSGAVAKQLGVPIEDLVTMLGEMANAGIKGSDAGTSVKQMLLSLAAPTEKSANLMKDLGINIFDAQGKFMGMSSIIGQFNPLLEKMTDKQKAATLATIFGSDAVRAAAIIFGKSAPEFERLKDIMEKQGAAAKLAEAKMKGFKGALEGLKSALETLAINIGEPLLRFATRAVKEFSKFVEWLDRLRSQKGFTAKIKFVWEGIKQLGGFLEDLIMGKGKTTELKMVMGRGPRWLTEIDKGLVGKLETAFKSINWSAVWKTALHGLELGREIAGKFFAWLDRQDWEGLGRRMGQAFVNLLKHPKLFGEPPEVIPTRPAPGARGGGGGGGIWDDFVQNLKNIGGLIEKSGGMFTDPNGFFEPIWKKAFQGITDQATDFAKGFFKGIWSKIEEDAQAATGRFQTIGGGFATTLTEGFSSYMRSTRGFQREAQTGANEVRATGGQYGAAGTHLGQSTSTGLMGALAGMAAAASSKAGAGAAGIESKKGAYGSAGQGLGNATSSGLTGALAGMAAAAGTKAAAGATAISGKKGGYTTAGQVLGNSTKSGLTGALTGLGAAAGAKVDQAKSQVSAKAGSWAGIGSSLGSGLVGGLVGALSGLATSAISQISGAIGAVKGFFGIGSPSRVTHEQLGKPLGQGVIQGWLDGTRELPSTMSDTVRKALDRAKAAVDAARAKFSEAFGTLASDAMSAFDKISSAFQTKTEKLINAKEWEFALEDANQRIADAQQRLAEAMAEGNAEAIADAQRELSRAQWDLEKMHLEKTAEAERRNYEARRELQKRHFEKALATLQQKLEDGKIKIGTFHAAVLKLFTKFGLDLGQLGDVGGKAFVKMLLESLGGAVSGAAGISAAINAALGTAGSGGGGGGGGGAGGAGGAGGGGGGGGGAPAPVTSGQPAHPGEALSAAGFNWYDQWWRKDQLASFRAALRQHGANYPTWAFNHPAIVQALGWPWMGKGGIVTRPTFAGLGERGPEAVIPLRNMSSMLSPTVNVYVTLDGRQIAASVRTENLQHGRRNPTIYSGTGITA